MTCQSCKHWAWRLRTTGGHVAGVKSQGPFRAGRKQPLDENHSRFPCESIADGGLSLRSCLLGSGP